MARQVGVKEYNLSWLYDTIRLTAGQNFTLANYFTVPRGQVLAGAVNKSFTHTNLTTSGLLAGIKSFKISSMVMLPQAFLPSQDINLFLEGNAVLFINEKPYPEYFPLKFFMGGTAWRESVRAPGPVGGNDFRAHPGDGRIDNVCKFKGDFKINIDTLENFRVDLRWDLGYVPVETFDLTLLLYGLAGREVM